MPLTIQIPAYETDTRANHLENWQYRVIGPSTVIYLCTSKDVVDVFVAGLNHLGRRVSRLEVTDPDEGRKWTHAVEIDTGRMEAVDDLLELLRQTLVLKRQSGMESAMALDWYKDPTTNEDPLKWANTAVGSLVYRAKYRDDRRAIPPLCQRLADAIARQPVYRDCVIASVPGHDTTKESTGERVAIGVAERTGQTLLKTTARTAVRPEAKTGEHMDLSEEFAMDERALLQGVLIVDDLYHSGATMKAVAAAAKRAGAMSVHGIAGVRTMRK